MAGSEGGTALVWVAMERDPGASIVCTARVRKKGELSV